MSLPDLESNLETISLLRKADEAGDDIFIRYELADAVSARARVTDSQHVMLWLGSSIMPEYTLDEATAMLQSHVDKARTSMISYDLDLDFLKEQITTTEVNIARVYNWDVIRKRSTPASAEAEE
jgi:prefoldin subunit 5